jgi:hypothetical protein
VAPRSGEVKVAYIGGTGRSGSTLLDLMLGALPGFVAVGELARLWDRGLRENVLCGCREHFLDCPFWGAVGESAFGGWSTLGSDELVALRPPHIARVRHFPQLLAPRLRTPELTAGLRRYADRTTAVYRAIADVSGCRVVVDSSKSVGHAFLLARLPGLDARVIHLVRDSRGVAHSWQRLVVRPEIVGERATLNIWSPTRASVEWLAQNGSYHFVPLLGIPCLRVRYETLVRSPRSEFERLLRHLDERVDASALEFLDRRELPAHANHTLSGNPLRFQRGELPLRIDDEWRLRMSRGDRAKVLALTWPLLAAYGYLREGGKG